MQGKDKGQNTSPCVKKKVRICSLNSQKRKVLTECSADQNMIATTPPIFGSPRVINLHKKEINEQRKCSQNASLQKNNKIRGQSVKTQAIQRKFQSSQEFDKLLEITSRCVDYYNKFTQQKDAQIRIVRQAFADIHENLNIAFNGIIIEVKNKHNQIKDFLQKKQNQLIRIKDQQETELNANLNDVKSVHLVNLLRDYKSGDQSADLGEELCSYANTLHKFYEAIEKVEKCNFKQGVDETINFINNVVSQEIKFIIYEKIPSKSLNGSFSFNDGLGFGTSAGGCLNNLISPDFNCEQSIAESLEQSLQKCMRKNKIKEINEAWTQTLNDNLNPKNSVLETLNEINRQQNQMRMKIEKYKEFKL